MSATLYYAIVKYPDGHIAKLLYPDATSRALQLIALSPYITVIEEGVQ